MVTSQSHQALHHPPALGGMHGGGGPPDEQEGGGLPQVSLMSAPPRHSLGLLPSGAFSGNKGMNPLPGQMRRREAGEAAAASCGGELPPLPQWSLADTVASPIAGTDGGSGSDRSSGGGGETAAAVGYR